MDPVVAGVLVGAAALSLIAVNFLRGRGTQDRGTIVPGELLVLWRAAAEAARLTDVRLVESFQDRPRLWGRAGALSVRLDTFVRGNLEGTVVVIRELGHRPGELSFRAEGVGSALAKALGRGELELGDPAFDDAVDLQGSPELACALFDAETRLAVTRLLRGVVAPAERSDVPRLVIASVSLADDELRIELPRPATLGLTDEVAPGLCGAIPVARRLVRPPDLAAALARNLREDPLPAVRLSNLRVLVERHRDHPAAREALTAALADPDEEIRLRAALALGEQGHATLAAIASSPESDDRRAARAVHGLGDALPLDLALDVLEVARHRVAAAEACLAALGPRGGREVVDALARVLAREDWALGVAAARALGASGEAAAEGPLVEALHSISADLRVAAAKALGHVGSAAAVPTLRGAAERFGDAGLRRAVRQSVAAIQARLAGASPGQLSLASGEAGQVALVDKDSRGIVSLANEGPPPGPDRLR
jgi:HEAT repeat protein